MRVGVSLPVREMENDLGAIKAYAQLAETLGLSHLRVPDQVLRVGSGHLHEPMTLMAYLAGVTERIELVPSVIVLPSRQTALVAKQAAEIDILSGGRLRLGIGVGGSEDEYRAMGVDFHTRGARCDEQLELLNLLWTRETVEFDGRFDQITGAGLNPLPVQRPIPIWIGARPVPGDSVIKRIGRYAAGWFVLADPTQYPDVAVRIAQAARANGRNPAEIGAEAGVAVVGPREAEWKGRVKNWRETGLTHLCLRTLGGGLDADQHLAKIREAVAQLPETE
jgi:probable F420-dependent oxidoreductase